MQGQHGPLPQQRQGVWCTKCQIHFPTTRSLHSSIFVVSMISFWMAAKIHQFTIHPEPFTSFAAKTKQASWGPRLVANIPAPHGHQVVTNLLPCFFCQQFNIGTSV